MRQNLIKKLLDVSHHRDERREPLHDSLTCANEEKEGVNAARDDNDMGTDHEPNAVADGIDHSDAGVRSTPCSNNGAKGDNTAGSSASVPDDIVNNADVEACPTDVESAADLQDGDVESATDSAIAACTEALSSQEDTDKPDANIIHDEDSASESRPNSKQCRGCEYFGSRR